MKLSERIPHKAGCGIFKVCICDCYVKEIIQLEAELLKFRRLDIAWGEQAKEDEITITNLKEELEHLHTRFDRILDDSLKEGE